jgi:hypothetical protein
MLRTPNKITQIVSKIALRKAYSPCHAPTSKAPRMSKHPKRKIIKPIKTQSPPLMLIMLLLRCLYFSSDGSLPINRIRATSTRNINVNKKISSATCSKVVCSKLREVIPIPQFLLL